MRTIPITFLPQIEVRQKRLRGDFQPGGWGDKLIFGYMFRVITGLSSIMFPGLVIIVLGAIDGWRLTNAMLWFFGVSVAVLTLVGEILRLGVYEARVKGFIFKKYNSSKSSEIYNKDLFMSYSSPSIGYVISKRIFDIIFSLAMIIILMPLFLMVSVLIKFESRGPIFTQQMRLGFRGRRIKVHKFRTLKVGFDHRPNNVALTKVGVFLKSTSIDELPTIFDVLVGNLSWVGPMALPVNSLRQDVSVGHFGYIPRGGRDKYPLMMVVLQYAKPGLTGIYSPGLDFRESMDGYLRNRSLFTDMKIFFLVFRHAWKKS